MKSFAVTDGPREIFVHYLIAGPGDGLLSRSGHTRSDLLMLIAGVVSKAQASKSECLEVLAYCIDDRWLRAVIRSASRRLRREHLRSLVGEPVGREADIANFKVVHSVRLETVAAQLAAVRHCHFAPVHARLVRDPTEWHGSSHRIYLGLEQIRGFTRSWIANLLADNPGGWSGAYRRLMTEPLDGDKTVTLANVDVPILPGAEVSGDPACLRALRQRSSKHSSATEDEYARAFKSLEDQVCRTTGCDPAAFRADPGARRFRLERALLVDRMMGIDKLMSIPELAAHLHCDPSWLYRTRAQCRNLYPALFSTDGGSGAKCSTRSAGHG